jgi:hypothetical protein
MDASHAATAMHIAMSALRSEEQYFGAADRPVLHFSRRVQERTLALRSFRRSSKPHNLPHCDVSRRHPLHLSAV